MTINLKKYKLDHIDKNRVKGSSIGLFVKTQTPPDLQCTDIIKPYYKDEEFC